jgi:hypothetical protein
MSKLNADIPSVLLNYSDSEVKNKTQANEITTVIFTKEQQIEQKSNLFEKTKIYLANNTSQITLSLRAIGNSLFIHSA